MKVVKAKEWLILLTCQKCKRSKREYGAEYNGGMIGMPSPVCDNCGGHYSKKKIPVGYLWIPDVVGEDEYFD